MTDRAMRIAAGSLCLWLTTLLYGCGGGGGGGDAPAAPAAPVQSPAPSADAGGGGTAPPVTGEYQTPYPYVDVVHTSLAFDAARERIYAYVPTAGGARAGTIAIIDARTRAISYSAPLGFVPWTMTVSPDGRYLYAGTVGTNEVIRLSLPDFSVDLRVALGADATALFATANRDFDAGRIAVSPVDSETFAVSLVDHTYWTCGIGVRVYRNSTVTAQFYNTVDTQVGDVLAFEADGSGLTTACSGAYPTLVTRVSYSGSALAVTASATGYGGLPATVNVSAQAILTGSGTKFDMPGFTLRGTLKPLTLDHQGEFAPLLYGCVFADAAGAYAACLSHTHIPDGYPTFRAFVIYELTDGAALHAIPLDLTMTTASRIFRTGDGQFAVSVGFTEDNAIPLGYAQHIRQNTRIYFLSL